MVASIPPVAHFVWFGRTFPWLNWLALRSAADRGGYERVILHHADDLRGAPHFRALAREPRVECVPLNFPGLLEAGEAAAPGIAALGGRIGEAAATRSDLARLLLLWLHGGVYLDVDTVTLAPLDDLRVRGGFFCGAERLVWPGAVRASRSPLTLGGALLRSVTRDLLRRHPGGWRHFRRIERWFPAAANNAVLGAVPGHPFVAQLLARAAELPAQALARSRYALGPDLLQEALHAGVAADVRVLPPEVFFPLGPEISEHWFRLRAPGTCPRVEDVLHPATRIVHWYGSVRAREMVRVFDADYVRAHRDRQLLAALAAPWVEAARSVPVGGVAAGRGAGIGRQDP